MIAHYYECDRCHSQAPIVWTGFRDDHFDRLPDGWILVITKETVAGATADTVNSDQKWQSYCPSCSAHFHSDVA